LTEKTENSYENGMVRELVLPPDEAPKTAANFLKKRFPVGYVRKLFRKNGIRLNGKHCKPTEVLGPGDILQLFIPFEAHPTAPAAKDLPIHLDVVFENPDFLVINKPAGLAVHEGKGVPARHSLLGALQTRLALKNVVPKLVHRLDKETSGLLIAAKTDAAAAELQARFESGDVDKEYRALVVGNIQPPTGRVELPLPGREGNLVSALTLYQVERRFSATALLRVRIKTGRMHQIRLHLARWGHPVVMDSQHGDFAFNKAFRKTYGLKRQFLHASSISLEHKGRQWKWTAPLPGDLSATLAALESAR
jgi:23S rRNA pseudouridine955/2504/2580 synthase